MAWRASAESRPPLAPVRAVTVHLGEQVAGSLREGILQGELKPGEKLVQGQLAERLEVSRQPVREALRRLQAEGLVERLTSGGVAVRACSERDIREIYELRQLLEPRAAALATARLSSAQRRRLRELADRFASETATGDGPRLRELNDEFHWTIYRAADSPRLLAMIEQLWYGWMSYTPILQPRRARQSVEEHRRIVAVLETGGPEEAAEALRLHIADAAEGYFAARAQEGGAGDAPV